MIKMHLISRKGINSKESYFLSKISFKDVPKAKVPLLKLLACGKGIDLINKFKTVVLMKDTIYAGFRLGKFLKLATCSYTIDETVRLTDNLKNQEGIGVVTVLAVTPIYDEKDSSWYWKIYYEGVINE